MSGIVVVELDELVGHAHVAQWSQALAQTLGRHLDAGVEAPLDGLIDVDAPDYLALEARRAARTPGGSDWIAALRSDLQRWRDPSVVCSGGPLLGTLRHRLTPAERRTMHARLRPELAGRVLVQPLAGPARHGLGALDTLCAGLGVVRLPALDPRHACPHRVAATLRRMTAGVRSC